MDRKHAMLYPPLDPSSNHTSRSDRLSASAAIGLPAEAPPSYDVAMSAGPSAAAVTAAADGSRTLGIAAEPSTTAAMAEPTPFQPLPTVPPANAVPSSRSGPKLGPNPCAVQCPACSSCKTTRMSYTPNTRTHLSALLLCLVGWCCCACCVPYCMNSCRTGNHYCAKCNSFLGSFNPHDRRN